MHRTWTAVFFLLAFTACVTLSLIAAASFDPHSLWDTEQ